MLKVNLDVPNIGPQNSQQIKSHLTVICGVLGIKTICRAIENKLAIVSGCTTGLTPN